MTAKEYTQRVRDVLFTIHRDCHLYQGKEGALRIAREYGYGLADFDEKEAENEIRNSYMSLCVRGYDLKPPIDAKDWNKAVKEGYQKALNRRGGFNVLL